MKRLWLILLIFALFRNLAACQKIEEDLNVTTVNGSAFETDLTQTEAEDEPEPNKKDIDGCETCTMDKGLWIYGEDAYINGTHQGGIYRVSLQGGPEKCLLPQGEINELYGSYLFADDEEQYWMMDLEGEEKWIPLQEKTEYHWRELAGEYQGKLYFFGSISEPGKEDEAAYFCDTVDLKNFKTERIPMKEEYRKAIFVGNTLYFKRTALVDGSMKGWLYKTEPEKWEEERLCEIYYNAEIDHYKDLLVFAGRGADPACYDLNTGETKVLKDFEFDATNAWVRDGVLICSYNKGYWAYDMEARTEIDPVEAGVSPDQAYGNIHPDGMVQEWTHLSEGGIVNYGIEYAEFLYQGQKQRLEFSMEDCLTHGNLWTVAINENGAAWLRDWEIYTVDWEEKTFHSYNRKSFSYTE